MRLLALLTHPYSLTLFFCGALALAAHRLLAPPPPPRRRARRRVVSNSVRQPHPGTSIFDFLCTDSKLARIDLDKSRLLLVSSTSTSSHTTDVSNDSPQLDVPVSVVRIVEKGLHLHSGRAVRLDVGQHPEHQLLVFVSRHTAQAFTAALTRAHPDFQVTPPTARVFLTTFNLGEARPPDDLSIWLARARTADVVAIGAQECSYSLNDPHPVDDDKDDEADDFCKEDDVPLLSKQTSQASSASSSSSSSVFNSDQSTAGLSRTSTAERFSSDKEHWHALLANHFPEDEFVCVVRHSAWNRCLTMFVRRELVHGLSDVRVDTANVGIGGVAGNKGAIGARLTLFDTSFLIINAHLAAHHKEVIRRNDDFASIAGGLHSLRDDPELDSMSSAIHHVFWIGDLNYRINLSRDDVLQRVKQQDWATLQNADQLREEMADGRVFQGFREGVLNFAPTYRYDRGSRKYSEFKLRIPSYTDRILFRSLPGCEVTQHEYQACNEIMSSDHSPVWATFSARLEHITGKQPVEEFIDEDDNPSFPRETYTPALESSPSLPRTLARDVKVVAPGGLQVQFRSLQARDIPAMDYPGRRMAVAKALHIDSHLAWKKHVDLGDGQQADPYCTFHGTAVAELDEGEFRTVTAEASQNPLWQGDEIPDVELVVRDRKLLRHLHVVITVMDENMTRRDRTIGSTVVSLAAAVSGEPVRFAEPIMRAGQRRGDIFGEFVVR